MKQKKKYFRSTREKEAYERGEMPMSRWKKADIIEMIDSRLAMSDKNPRRLRLKDGVYDRLIKLNTTILKDYFLTHVGRMNTSRYQDYTDFYAVDFEYLEEIEVEDIDRIVMQEKQMK